ncbi:DUF7662 domain-containing protein [Paraburkholderia aromaticivorans]|nr:hypothetical protein [Paraburkholderia aromaticivorans]
MSKYAPLADYLRNLDRNEVTLSFDEIERILGFSLPPTASRFRPYWSNSGVKDGHPGRLWRDAGWRQVRIDLTGRHVSFRRADAMTSDLESKTIPDRSEDQPSATGLTRRHERFLEAEHNR